MKMVNLIRCSPCLSGVTLLVLVMPVRLEALEVRLFESVVLADVSIVIFLIGCLSPRQGFDGMDRQSIAKITGARPLA